MPAEKFGIFGALKSAHGFLNPLVMSVGKEGATTCIKQGKETPKS